jgi:hypothetical protein
MLSQLLFSIALGSMVAQATPGPSSSPSPTPAPAPTPLVTPTPLPTFTPVPLPTVPPPGTPRPLPTPWPTPAALPTPLELPDDAAPQILAVQISDPVLHGGETITGTVVTSTNVAAVEVQCEGRHTRVPRSDLGVFQLTYQIPHLPFFMRHKYNAKVVATNSAGVTVERDFTFSVR